MKTLLTVLFLACLTSQAAVVTNAQPYYKAGEFNLDVYGYGNLKNEASDPDDNDFGLGLGATYFFTRNVGLGVRADSASAAHSFVDLVQARLTYRLPYEHFAPYGYLESGFHFERDNWQGGTGLGLEYRFHRYYGIYIEGGPSVDTDGVGQLRGVFGLRFSY